MWLTPRPTSNPAIEPVEIVSARQFLRIAEDDTSFDGELIGMIAAARVHVEAMTGTPLIARTFELEADSFADLDRLPIAPIGEEVSISYIDSAGDEQELASGFELFGSGLDWGIRCTIGASWPQIRPVRGAVKVTVTAGYGATAADIPAPIRTAILLLVGDWFRNREDSSAGAMQSIPNGVSALLTNFRIWL